MKTAILGGQYIASSSNAGANRMINLYPEAIPEGGKEPGFLSRCPGLVLKATVGSGPIRGELKVAGVGYVVSGQELYKLTSTYSSRLLGTVSGSGPVSMADNGVQIFIACNPRGFIYNISTDTFQEITDTDFPGAVTVDFIDQYFVFNEPDSQRFWVTSLLDGTAIDPLEFASAEGSPDLLVACKTDHREVWLFGTNSVEVYYNSGALDFPLTRIQGAFIEIGCSAAYSIAKLDNALFWLGSDDRGSGVVYRADGYAGKRVSDHSVETIIQKFSTISDAVAYTYQQSGHSFYVLTFPTAGRTFCYDVATNLWHERAGWEKGLFLRHRGNAHMSFNNQPHIGDYENGNIYTFDLEIYADNGEIQKWLRSWRAIPTGKNSLSRVIHHFLQLDAEAGVGITPDFSPAPFLSMPGNLSMPDDLLMPGGDPWAYTVGEEALVSLRWSDDGGHKWSNEHWKSLGRIGDTLHRPIWRRLGISRDRVYELSGTDPNKIAIMGAELKATPTGS